MRVFVLWVSGYNEAAYWCLFFQWCLNWMVVGVISANPGSAAVRGRLKGCFGGEWRTGES